MSFGSTPRTTTIWRLRIGQTRAKFAWNVPTFSGFGQFNPTSCPLGNRPVPPFSTTDMPLAAVPAAEPTLSRSRFRSARAGFPRNPRFSPHGRGRRAGCRTASRRKCSLLAVAFDEMHLRARRLRERAGDHQARETRPRAEIGPNARLRRQRQELQRVGDMARPQHRYRSTARSGSSAAASQQARQSGRDGRLFHVKQASAPAPARDLPTRLPACAIMPRRGGACGLGAKAWR